MTSLPFSAHQLAAIRALAATSLTARDLARAIGVTGGIGGVLQALHQRGVIRYVGGPGVKLGHGQWQLTKHGDAIAKENREP